MSAQKNAQMRAAACTKLRLWYYPLDHVFRNVKQHVIIQHPIKMYGLKGETLAFRTKTTRFYGADKARSASVRPHEQAAKWLRMRVLKSYNNM